MPYRMLVLHIEEYGETERDLSVFGTLFDLVYNSMNLLAYC